MRGRGTDDYIWISPDDVVNVFPNKNNGNCGAWDAAVKVLETGRDRRSLHIGDWDGDGKDDIISVARKNGALTIWLNRWENNVFSFQQRQIDGQFRDQGRGVRRYDNGHHFASIRYVFHFFGIDTCIRAKYIRGYVNGKRRVDFLCMEKSGRTTAWLNQDGTEVRMLSVGQVKYSENLDRANFRFADVNGTPNFSLITRKSPRLRRGNHFLVSFNGTLLIAHSYACMGLCSGSPLMK